MNRELTSHRNNEIEFFRFLFICAIAIMHFSNSYFKSAPYFSGAYIGTEFFFLISGFMIIKSADNREDSPFLFTLQRVKKLYPHYLLAFIMLFLLSVVAAPVSLLEALRSLSGYIFELLFLHASGLKSFSLLNYPTWYLSSLLIGGFFIYSLIRWNRKLYLTIIAPFAVLVTYSFFSANTGHLDVWGGNQFLNLSDSLTRGFAAMSLGTLAYSFSKYLCSQNYQLPKLIRFLLSFLELMLFICVFVGSTFLADTQYDFYFVLLLFIAVTLAFSGLTYTDRLFAFPIFSYLGKISYPMYVYQLFIICIFCLFCPNLSYSAGIVTFLAAIIAFSIVMDLLLYLLFQRKTKHS